MRVPIVVLFLSLGLCSVHAKSLTEKSPVATKLQENTAESTAVKPEKVKTSNFGNTDLEDFPEDTPEEQDESIDDNIGEDKTRGHIAKSPFRGYHGYGLYHHGHELFSPHALAYGFGPTLVHPMAMQGFLGGYPRFHFAGPWVRPTFAEWGYGRHGRFHGYGGHLGFHGYGNPGFFVSRMHGGGGDDCKCKPPSADKKQHDNTAPSNEGGDGGCGCKPPPKKKSGEAKTRSNIPFKRGMYDTGCQGCFGHPPLFPYNVKWTQTKDGYKVDIKKVKHEGDVSWPKLYSGGFGYTNGYGGHVW